MAVHIGIKNKEIIPHKEFRKEAQKIKLEAAACLIDDNSKNRIITPEN